MKNLNEGKEIENNATCLLSYRSTRKFLSTPKNKAVFWGLMFLVEKIKLDEVFVARVNNEIDLKVRL